ncbi:hypothetical protein SLA2020_365510 [Shorea laevis]
MSLPAIFFFFFSATLFSFSHGDSHFPPLQAPPISGWENEGSYGVEHSWGPSRSLVEGPTSAPVENPSFVLASERTQRKDPLDEFKKYTKGWNISDRHYWAVSLPILSFSY